MVSAAVIGGDKLRAKFNRLGKEKDIVIDDLVFDTALYVQDQAKKYARDRAGSDTGALVQKIRAYKEKNQMASVISEAPYSGYVEFGTGKQVRIPPEFADMASKIRRKRKGKFREGLRAIEDWCGRNGIRKEAAYPIFMAILRRGLKARPFMYPAYLRGRRKLIENATTELNKMLKKYN